jgi:hypothetical protein
MNTLTTNPDAARIIARHTIDERVRNAEERRTVRAARAGRRSAARDRLPAGEHLPARWTLHFLHPAT